MKMVELWIQSSLVYASSKWLKQSRGQEPWGRKGQGTEMTFPNATTKTIRGYIV